jgi:hypothetical protein
MNRWRAGIGNNDDDEEQLVVHTMAGGINGHNR